MLKETIINRLKCLVIASIVASERNPEASENVKGMVDVLGVICDSIDFEDMDAVMTFIAKIEASEGVIAELLDLE